MRTSLVRLASVFFSAALLALGTAAHAQLQVVAGSSTVGGTTTSFPSTAIGASSVTLNVQVKANVSLSITGVTAAASQGGKQEYVVGALSGCTLGSTVSAGTVCTIPVTFTPAYPGRRRVPLQFVTSAGNINFGLTGVGLGPLVTLTPGIISTFAGMKVTYPDPGPGEGGPATKAHLYGPEGLAIDAAGNVYISDSFNETVRRVDAVTGIITTVAGVVGTSGYAGDGGPATNALLNFPDALAIDAAGRLYIADRNNLAIRRVDLATGTISTIAGYLANATYGPTGDGGLATSAQVGQVLSLALDSTGNLYLSAQNSFVIRKIDAASGIISTVVGNGTHFSSGDGGQALNAGIPYSVNVAVDDADNLYVAESSANKVRKVDPLTGIINTVAGSNSYGYSGDGGLATNATLNYPDGVVIDSGGNLFIADSNNDVLRRVSAASGLLSTIAGTAETQGYSGDNGPATHALLSQPNSMATDSVGNLYVIEFNNFIVRKIATNQAAVIFATSTAKGQNDLTDNPQVLDVMNSGNRGLTLAPGAGSNNPTSISPNFNFDSSSTCPQQSGSATFTLASGADCTYAINFTPATDGAITGSTSLTDNSLSIVGSTQTISLSGTALPITGTTTNITLSSSKNPSVYGDTLTYTFTVTPTSGTAVPAGTVQLVFDGKPFGGALTLNSAGIATLVDSTLVDHLTAVAPHTLTATFTPSSSAFTGSNSSPFVQIVNRATVVATIIGSQLIGNTTPVSKVYDGTTAISLAASKFSVTGSPDNWYVAPSIFTSTGAVPAIYPGTFSTAAAGSSTVTAPLTASSFTTFTNASQFYPFTINNNFPSFASGPGLITPAPLGGSIVGNPTKPFDGNTNATLTSNNFMLTGFVSGESATVTKTTGSYASSATGTETVTVSLAASDFAPVGMTNLANYTLPTTVSGPGTIGASSATPIVTVTPAGPVIAFATTAVGSSSASQSIQLKLNQAVSIGSISSPVSAGGVQEYVVGAITGCVVDGATVNAAGTICVVPVVFHPGYPGNRAIPLQVATSGGNVNFGMNGKGTGPLAVLTPGLLSTVAGGGGSAAVEGGAATAAQLLPGTGMAIDNQGNMYFGAATKAGYFSWKIYRVDAKTGAITTYAGVAAPAGYSGDGGPALSATINSVSYLTFDAAGNLYFSDTADCTVREIVAATGIIQTVAGTLPDMDNYPTCRYTGDGGPAVQAQLALPAGLAIDAAGNLLIADQANSVIRRVDAVTGNISTIAGTTQGYLGTGGPALSAQLNNPNGIALDTAGNLYIAEPNNAWVRRVDAVTGILSLVAGTGTSRYGADGGLATSTTLVRPTGVAVDPAGNIYITDLDLVSQSNSGAGSVTSTGRVRKVSAATGVISTIAGGGAIAGAVAGQVGGDGSVATSAALAPVGVALDSAGKIYFSDLTSEEERGISASTSALVFPTCTQSCPPVLGEQVLLSNIGSGPLSLTAPTVGANPSYSIGWTQDSSSSCPQIMPGGAAYVLAAGASCSVVADLNPASPPSGSGVLTLADTSLNAASTQTVALVPSTIAAGTTITSLSASFLTSYPGPVYGTAVTLMASVAEDLPLSGHQTSGTVTFYANGAAIAAATNVAVTNGIAKVAVTTFNAGDTTVTATYTPAAGNGLLASNAPPLTVTLGKAYADIGYSSSTSKSSYVYDGQPHGYTFFTIPAGLNFTVSYTDTVSYSSSPNAPIEPGSYQQLGTIVDPNYTGYTNPLFTITKIPATVTLGGLSAPNDGQPHSATATTVPAGLNVTFTYDGSTTPPSSAGSHAVVATVNDAHYSGTATGTLIIGNQQAATVTLGNLNATYDGNPHPVTVTTVPAGLATSVTYTGYNGPVTVPVAAGSYAVAANITDPAYTGSTSATLAIAQAQLQIIFGNLRFTYDGKPHVPSTTTVPAGYQVTLIYDYPAGPSSTPPTAPGMYTVVATAGDNNYTGFASTSMTILAATAAVPTITVSPTANTLTTAQALNVAVTIAGGTGKPVPTGSITLSATGYTSAATPLSAGNAAFIVPAGALAPGMDTLTATYTPDTASAATYSTAVGSASVTVVAPTLSIITTTIPTAQVGTNYSAVLATTGGTAPLTWMITSGVLPRGIAFNTAAGTFSGTPQQFGSGAIGLKVTDSSTPQQNATATYTLTVISGLDITTTSNPDGKVGTPYSTGLTPTGGAQPYKWSITGGALPAGLTLDANSGVISGTPTTQQVATFTIQIADSEGTPAAATKTFNINIAAAALANSTTMLSSSSSATGVGVNVTFTATVTGTASTPNGQVTFYNGTTSLGTGTLNTSGVATFTTSFSTPGVYSITAAYSGNTTTTGSTSAPLSETVVAAGVSAAFTPDSLTIISGSSGTLILTLTPRGGYTGTVSFSCGSLPAHVTCTFAPPSLTIASTTTVATSTLTINTAAPTQTASLDPSPRGLRGGAVAMAVSLLIIFGARRRRSLLRNLLMLAVACVALAGASAITGCGSASPKAVPGTYAVPVTLTLSGGITQTVNASVIIQ